MLCLLCMLLVCVHSYVKSVLRYNHLIMETCHPDTLYLHEQECEDPWLFFETEMYPWAKSLGNTDIAKMRLQDKTIIMDFIFGLIHLGKCLSIITVVIVIIIRCWHVETLTSENCTFCTKRSPCCCWDHETSCAYRKTMYSVLLLSDKRINHYHKF